MKKITLSLIATIAMTGTLMAGGDMALVVEEVQAPVVVDDSGFYLGLAYSALSLKEDQPAVTVDFDTNMLNFIAGYNFNQYVAIEGRYGLSVGDTDVDISDGVSISDYDADIQTFSIFVKPQYSWGSFKGYGLLGYGSVKYDLSAEGAYNVTDGGFQYGIGAAYSFNNIEVFADYTVLYADSGIDGLFPNNDYNVDAWTFGVNYKF